MLSSIRASLLLVTLALVGCQAQSSYTLWVDDSNHVGPGIFDTRFIGLKLDTNGYAYVNAVSGDYAGYQHVLSFASHYQTPDVFGGSYEFPFSFSATGTYWVYLSDYGSTTNWDWLEIRIVSNSFSGTISPIYGAAPTGWQIGWPPASSSPMQLGEHPEVPASQPAATNYTKWLVPLLVVVIVTALLVPVAMYIRRRRQQNKEMQATAAQVENTAQDATMVQMTSV